MPDLKYSNPNVFPFLQKVVCNACKILPKPLFVWVYFMHTCGHEYLILTVILKVCFHINKGKTTEKHYIYFFILEVSFLKMFYH